MKAAQVARVIVALVVVIVLVIIGYLIYSLFNMFASDVLKGGEVVTVPDVVGLTEDEANAELHRLGLAAPVRNIQRLHSDLQPIGNVFKQEPTAGSKTKRTTVKLWISLGKASFIVPALTGNQLSEAAGILRDSGLLVGKITKVYRPEMPPGLVVNQDPGAGKEYTSAIPVDIVVVDNGNRPLIEMPDLRGKRLSSVEAQLVHANLHLAKVTYVGDDTVPDTTVVKQSIEAGQEIELGSRVELEVAVPTALKSKSEKTVTIHVPIPPGPERQLVKIKVFDDHSSGGSVVYEQMHAADSVVDHRQDIKGEAVIFIFIDDMDHPYREERL